MSHGNQSYLRFSLEESVWFQKGQEVEDLISISLDPNITIQESDQYITIKGALELTGEYSREEYFIDEEENLDYFSKNPKTVQMVELREEEGLYAFTHQFPVEVTIPKNRIQNLDDIDVTVETFDYAFPEKSCLRLSADLMILGLYGEQQHGLYEEEQVDHYVEMEEIEEEDQPIYHDDYPTNESDFSPYSKPEFPEIDVNQVYKPYEEARITQENSEDISPFSKPEISELDHDIYEPFEVEARKTPEEEKQSVELSEFQSFEEKYPDISLLGNEEINRKETPKAEKEELELQTVEIPDEGIRAENAPAEEPEAEEVVPEITFTSQQSKEEVENTEETEEVILEQENEETESSSSSSPQMKKKLNKLLKNKQSITLSEFFARKDEEEHTRLKMCIVQQGDTLEIISERYAVPVSQIQRVNQMELNQDIYEGQVLYIPQAQTQR